MMKLIKRGSGKFGVSFEYKKDGNWTREERYFLEASIRDAAIKSIRKHPYNWRVKKI